MATCTPVQFWDYFNERSSGMIEGIIFIILAFIGLVILVIFGIVKRRRSLLIREIAKTVRFFFFSLFTDSFGKVNIMSDIESGTGEESTSYGVIEMLTPDESPENERS